ncbi:MAG: ribosomal protein S18-alanine N-acetyltransferase [Acholeplasmataceae bacterium]
MIRHAKIEDIAAIVKIEKKVFKETLGDQFLYQEIKENPFAVYYVYEMGHEVIGYIGFRYDQSFCEMMNFCMTPTHQNEGYGKELLEVSMHEMMSLGVKTFTLEVRQSNLVAQHVYERMGFKKSHIRKNYYQNEDAIVYIKEVQA